MTVEKEEPTGILPSYAGTYVNPLPKGSGIATPVGKPSISMVDLYSLPVQDLVNEIRRLARMYYNSEREIGNLQDLLDKQNHEIKQLKIINEAGKKANQNQKKILQQIRSLTDS